MGNICNFEYGKPLNGLRNMRGSPDSGRWVSKRGPLGVRGVDARRSPEGAHSSKDRMLRVENRTGASAEARLAERRRRVYIERFEIRNGHGNYHAMPDFTGESGVGCGGWI